MKKLIFCISLGALFTMHNSNGMMRSMLNGIRPMNLQHMTPVIIRRAYTLSTQPDFTKKKWPDYTIEQREKLARLTVARLNEEYPRNSSNHPVRDERELRKFINRVASEICPGQEENSTGHLAHQCLRCGPARRGALPEVKAAFRF
jgi:hypothetical protein